MFHLFGFNLIHKNVVAAGLKCKPDNCDLTFTNDG